MPVAQDNAFWLGLLTHLQSDRVPHKRLECLRDLTACYQVMLTQMCSHDVDLDAMLCYLTNKAEHHAVVSIWSCH